MKGAICNLQCPLAARQLWFQVTLLTSGERGALTFEARRARILQWKISFLFVESSFVHWHPEYRQPRELCYYAHEIRWYTSRFFFFSKTVWQKQTPSRYPSTSNCLLPQRTLISVKMLNKESESASPTIGTRDRSTIDIFSIHEQQAGRLVLDPAWVLRYLEETSNTSFFL